MERALLTLVEEPESQKMYGPVYAEYDLGTKGAKYMVLDGGYKYTFWVHYIDESYNLREDRKKCAIWRRQPSTRSCGETQAAIICMAPSRRTRPGIGHSFDAAERQHGASLLS